MVISKILNYQKHIKTIFRPLIDLKINNLKSGVNNGATNNIVISLTTYGRRLKDVKYTLFSLFNQTLKPDRIVLWLDNELNSDKTQKLLHTFIQNGLEIKFTKDIGPYTKLIPSLRAFPAAIIVTADDDIYYPKNWLKKLYNSYLEDKSAIHCHRAHRIKIKNGEVAPYKEWGKQIESAGNSSFDYFLTGVGGVLYPPEIFTDEIFNEEKFLSITPKADDIWFWGMAVLSGIKIRIVPDNIPFLKSTNILRQLNLLKDKTLYNYNQNGGNDLQLKHLLQHYPQIKEQLLKENKLKLIFDITALHPYKEPSGHRAGVFNTARNILTEFINDERFELTFYSDYKYYYFIKEIVSEFLKGKVLLDKRRWYEKAAGKLLYISNSMSKKLKYFLLYLFRCFDFVLPCNNALYKELNNYDAYFSPFDGVKKEFVHNPIKKYQLIHDVIPFIEGKKLPPYHWTKAIFANINENIFYFTNSEYTKQDFLKVFSQIPQNNVKTAYLGVTTQSVNEVDIYTKYNIPKNKKYFLSLCSLGKRKNLEFAVKNFITFTEQYHIEDLVFVLSGGIWSNYKQTLDKLIKNSSEKIIITGYIEDTDLPALYSNALAFIYPSLYEGFGLPPLEAMGYNCPVIASNRTSLPEICADAALLINPENDVELQDAYKTLYYNTGVRNIMIEKGYRRFKEFSWEKCANIIKEIILANKV